MANFNVNPIQSFLILVFSFLTLGAVITLLAKQNIHLKAENEAHERQIYERDSVILKRDLVIYNQNLELDLAVDAGQQLAIGLGSALNKIQVQGQALDSVYQMLAVSRDSTEHWKDSTTNLLLSLAELTQECEDVLVQQLHKVSISENSNTQFVAYEDSGGQGNDQKLGSSLSKTRGIDNPRKMPWRQFVLLFCIVFLPCFAGYHFVLALIERLKFGV